MSMIALPRKEPPVFTLPEISPSLDARAIEAPPGDYTLNAASAALGAGRNCAEKISATCRAIFADPTRTPAAQHVAAEDAASKIAKHGFEQLDAATARLNTEISALKTKVSTPPPIPALLAGEIRARLANMDQKTRRETLFKALAEGGGDDVVVAAALSAPGMLSGLTSDEMDALRAEWAVKRFPENCKRIASLEKAHEHLIRGGSLLLSFLMKSYDKQIVDNAKALQGKARSAIESVGRMQ